MAIVAHQPAKRKARQCQNGLDHSQGHGRLDLTAVIADIDFDQHANDRSLLLRGVADLLHIVDGIHSHDQKIFTNSATPAQVTAARALVEADLKVGVLVSANSECLAIFKEAAKLAEQHSAQIGCRSLDVLHCATANVLAADEFISTDARQKKLAVAMGLNLVTCERFATGHRVKRLRLSTTFLPPSSSIRPATIRDRS